MEEFITFLRPTVRINLLVRINLYSFSKSSFINNTWDCCVKAKAEDVCIDKVKGKHLRFSIQYAKVL